MKDGSALALTRSKKNKRRCPPTVDDGEIGGERMRGKGERMTTLRSGRKRRGFSLPEKREAREKAPVIATEEGEEKGEKNGVVPPPKRQQPTSEGVGKRKKTANALRRRERGRGKNPAAGKEPSLVHLEI